jgi:hypothetical protein
MAPDRPGPGGSHPYAWSSSWLSTAGPGRLRTRRRPGSRFRSGVIGRFRWRPSPNTALGLPHWPAGPAVRPCGPHRLQRHILGGQQVLKVAVASWRTPASGSPASSQKSCRRRSSQPSQSSSGGPRGWQKHVPGRCRSRLPAELPHTPPRSCAGPVCRFVRGGRRCVLGDPGVAGVKEETTEDVLRTRDLSVGRKPLAGGGTCRPNPAHRRRRCVRRAGSLYPWSGLW